MVIKYPGPYVADHMAIETAAVGLPGISSLCRVGWRLLQ